jgi:DNA-binding SARP family transcriptional activator/tetratricopeptide (TPR) repeat protein
MRPVMQARPDPSLRLRLLGEVALFRDGVNVALPPSKKTRGLLAYLAATARPQRRSRLCALFWDIPDDPRGALRWSLSRLRPLLDVGERKRIVADREHVALAVDSLDIDVHVVLRAAAREDAAASELIHAAALFEGEFAEGLDLAGCPDFQVWLTTEREAARRLHLQVLQRLVRSLPPDEAIPYAQRRLEVDPDDPDHHLSMLSLLTATGRRREAEQQAELSITRLRQVDTSAADSVLLQWRRLRQEPPQTAAPAEPRIAATPGVVRATEERKQVSVLCANLRGESLADDPEVAADRLGPVLSLVDAAITRYGGTVSQKRSDGVTALFGAPIAYHNHAVRACLAALAIQEGLANRALVPPVGIAIHSGEVLVRSVVDRAEGDAPLVEALGPALRIAQESERVAPAGSVYLTQQTYRLVDGMFRADVRDALSLPGLAEPIELLALTAQAAMADAWYARVIRGLTVFVGRDHELTALLRVAGKAQTGNGQVAVVVGEPGLGKSRLMHELLRQRDLDPTLWRRLDGSATPYDQDTPYYLVGRLLRSWLALGDRLPEGEIRERLRKAVTALDPALTWVEPALGVPLDLTTDDAWDAIDAGVRRRRVIDAVDAIVAALAARQPLLLLIEDLHWIDSDSAAIIEVLVSRLARRPVLLLVTTRPEGAPSWMAKSVCQPLRLVALDEAASEAMAEALLGADVSLSGVKRRLVERTAGTPLFLEESVSALVESGSLTGARGDYRLARQHDELRLPASLQAVLGERIDRLAAPLKLLLQVAAVIGDEIPRDVLLLLMDLEPAELDARLEALQDAEFLFETRPPPDRRFAFKHALIRDVAYASLLIAHRRNLHRRVLEIVLIKLGQRGEEMAERLAHHALYGERWSLAAKFLRLAGDKGVRRSAYGEAIRFYESALSALSKLPATGAAQRYSAAIRLRLRPPLGAVTAFSRAIDHLRVAEQIVAARGDIRQQISIAIHKSYILSSQGRLDAAIAEATRAVALSDQGSDPLSQLESRLALGQAHAFRGDIPGVLAVEPMLRERLTSVLRHQRLGQTGLRSVWCLMHLADAMILCGDLPAARQLTAEATEIAEEVGNPYDRALAHLREGFIEIQAGNADTAVAIFGRSRTLAEGSNLPWVAAWARTGLGYAHVLSGHADVGLRLLEATRRQASDSEFVAVQARCAVFLADARRRSGQWREAQSEAADALALARHWGYWDIEVMALLCLGRTALDQGDPERTALAPLREAATLAESRGYRFMIDQARQSMARALGRAGDSHQEVGDSLR